MSSKLLLNIVVFEDDPTQKELLESKVKVMGFNVKILFIDPTDFYDPKEDVFNESEFLDKINELVKGNYIHLIASDWNLFNGTEKCPTITGIDMVQKMSAIQDKFRKTQYLLYSGNIDEASKYVLDRIKKEIDERNSDDINAIQLLSLVLNSRIKFIKRGLHFDEIVQLVSSEKNISSIVLNSLETFHQTTVINTGNDEFDGRTIGHFLTLIQQNDNAGFKFIKEFTDLGIANYTEINGS